MVRRANASIDRAAPGGSRAQGPGGPRRRPARAYQDDTDHGAQEEPDAAASEFDHWQSAALGIPNSLIGLVVFTIIAATGLAGLLGSRLNGRYLTTVLGLSVFMAAFVTWYLAESAYLMRVLCRFCLGCAFNILIATAGLTRIVAIEDAISGTRTRRALHILVRSGGDLIL